MACKILNAKGSPETNIKGNIIINNAQVLAQANPSIDLTKLALEVTLTEGANISPDPARVMDYSHPQKFTVTSEDGNWHKEYSVIIDTFDLPLRYDFEHYELNETGKYQVFFEETQGTALFKQYIWASGNSGFALTGVGRNPQEYPTVSIENGIDGSRAIKLETKSTGQFGETVKMPIAAGNLFLGSFDVNNAVQKPLKPLVSDCLSGKNRCNSRDITSTLPVPNLSRRKIKMEILSRFPGRKMREIFMLFYIKRQNSMEKHWTETMC